MNLIKVGILGSVRLPIHKTSAFILCIFYVATLPMIRGIIGKHQLIIASSVVRVQPVVFPCVHVRIKRKHVLKISVTNRRKRYCWKDGYRCMITLMSVASRLPHSADDRVGDADEEEGILSL